MYVAHICVVLDPPVIIDVECHLFDVAEDGSVHVFLGGGQVGYFPSVEYVYVTGTPDEEWEEELDEEAVDREDEEADDEEVDDQAVDDDDDDDDDDALESEVAVLVPMVTGDNSSSSDNGTSSPN